ncbi:MAG: GHKL domain-containing protein [Bacteroidetes bacterium]|nr:MAG: GHKL domain-containing protein [Bacteroidota bacterium]
MHFESIILIIFFAYFRKNLRTKTLTPELDKQFVLGLGLSIGMVVLELVFPQVHVLTRWVAHAAAFGIAYTCFHTPALKPTRPILVAVLPLLVVNMFEHLLALVSRATLKRWDNGIEIAELVATSWMVIMLIIGRRQRKALAKAQKLAEDRERDLKLTQLLKDELEIQVNERTADLRTQKDELENALNELKSAQAQLIQSEKMASLGELTAGIAHEIQNPLNFVNNFSEVSSELVMELVEELEKGNADEVKAIAVDVVQNLQKINYHGKRAGEIVKGMLQHSRTSSGKKEPTDLNALCDEYLRLSYHGLRAKDKTFNATLKTQFDKSLSVDAKGTGSINLIPQDMGRVILNLITNAFYVVKEKANKKIAGYEPTVTVTTKRTNEMVVIEVTDNGNGIPPKILDKIFQPFFTTKPTGQGTGLGLSLSYDIVKAHGGDLKVETKEGEGSTFSIQLPIN